MLTLALTLLLACPESPPDGGATPAAPADKAADAPGAVPSAGLPPSSASFGVSDGDGVTLSGVITYGGEAEAALRLDVLTLEGDGPPALVHTAPLRAPGAFEIEAPSGFGEVHLVAFLDEAGDGPSPTDPAGTLTVEIGDQDLGGLSLEILDDPDLGPLTPMLPGIPSGDGGDVPGVAPPPDHDPSEEGPPPEAVDPPPEGAPPPPEGVEPPPEGVEPPPGDDAPE